MLAGVTPFGLHRLPVIYRAFGTACANNYIIAFLFVMIKEDADRHFPQLQHLKRDHSSIMN